MTIHAATLQFLFLSPVEGTSMHINHHNHQVSLKESPKPVVLKCEARFTRLAGEKKCKCGNKKCKEPHNTCHENDQCFSNRYIKWMCNDVNCMRQIKVLMNFLQCKTRFTHFRIDTFLTKHASIPSQPTSNPFNHDQMLELKEAVNGMDRQSRKKDIEKEENCVYNFIFNSIMGGMMDDIEDDTPPSEPIYDGFVVPSDYVIRDQDIDNLMIGYTKHLLPVKDIHENEDHDTPRKLLEELHATVMEVGKKIAVKSVIKIA